MCAPSSKFLPTQMVLDIVDSEPEFPGDPDSVYQEMLIDAMAKQDLDFFVDLFRNAVALTKNSIRSQILDLSNEGIQQ